jgi:hypothetical protein
MSSQDKMLEQLDMTSSSAEVWDMPTKIPMVARGLPVATVGVWDGE